MVGSSSEDVLATERKYGIHLYAEARAERVLFVVWVSFIAVFVLVLVAGCSLYTGAWCSPQRPQIISDIIGYNPVGVYFAMLTGVYYSMLPVLYIVFVMTFRASFPFRVGLGFLYMVLFTALHASILTPTEYGSLFRLHTTAFTAVAISFALVMIMTSIERRARIIRVAQFVLLLAAVTVLRSIESKQHNFRDVFHSNPALSVVLFLPAESLILMLVFAEIPVIAYVAPRMRIQMVGPSRCL
jgi:hypothetical protein